MMPAERGPDALGSPKVWWLIGAVCGVVVIQAVYGFLVLRYFGPAMDVRGQFGDIFGGVNALFTGLAFAGIIYTILLQRHELEVQRTELRLSTEELMRAAEAQIAQVSRLEESADLSAVTTLVEVYGTLLQPMWSNTEELRERIGDLESKLQDPDLATPERSSHTLDLNEAEGELRRRQIAWSDTLRKHQELVERLELLVGYRMEEMEDSLTEQENE